ncbi:hypothetical protein CEN44_18160 [Fischerella muscicola CCMEE 5323]|uniref:Uncharacterized protein n=1 Tax=Fischerella muscicola CCMEE 5323 TaxID=2019572 RepID=A0A2N6K037_FISMU|nr:MULTISPECIES: hypothetical protein [Fischerella]PLZ87175.1 hypothetical protein CEN44_18160 [Fischerella muscicola CCMEE 5323]
MSDASDWQHKLSQKYWQPSPYQTICSDCAFHIKVKGVIECIHPDELEINCSTVMFCNSFQSAQEVESPCVCFDDE